MKTSVQRLHYRYYDTVPSWVNGTEQFAAKVRRCLKPEMTVLNLGAGPGSGSLHFDREVQTIVGLDPDEAIELNQRLTHRIRGRAEALPFSDEAFDLVYMDWVVEHLSSPKSVAGEVFRVLKPNGVLLFRTGNVLHYSYAVAMVTPHWLHKFLLDGKNEREPYPTYYRMNTVKTVRRVMATSGFIEDELVMMEPDPAYVCMNRATFLAGVVYERTVNHFEVLRLMRANILGCFRKSAYPSRMYEFSPHRSEAADTNIDVPRQQRF
jgi:ubiquinone/menaquinone biosynthesis C-methylase UbiE